MTTKTCRECGKEKEFAELVKSRRSSYGYDNWCKNCKNRRRRENPPTKQCVVDSCIRTQMTSGSLYCPAHDYRLRKHGDVQAHIPVRDYVRDPQGWLSNGYRCRYDPSHPNANKAGVIAVHTIVMAEILGRPLVPGENVHHINGVRDDNRPENLELWNESQPAGQRVEDKVAWAVQMLELYAPERLCTKEN